MRLELGSLATDKITGFKGTITGYVTYITGCNQYLVQPRVKSDGEFIEPRWIDDDRLNGLATAGPLFDSQISIGVGPDMPAPKK